jgi:hypothetical protein
MQFLRPVLYFTLVFVFYRFGGIVPVLLIGTIFDIMMSRFSTSVFSGINLGVQLGIISKFYSLGFTRVGITPNLVAKILIFVRPRCGKW